ncbi:MAG: hypothetical protein DWQ36_16965 [Acidobacteria bacterium]|nr:MAG: hypothetical protein DWQ36_16965 [Acidobacteriota bacterium]
MLGPVVASGAPAEEFGRVAQELVQPLVAAEVRAYFGAGEDAATIEDATAQVGLQVWDRVRSGLGGEEPPIVRLRPYLRQAARAVCIDLLRRRHPRRTRLEYRMRYLERGDESWARRRLPNGQWQAELAAGVARRAGGTAEAERLLAAVHFELEASGGSCGWGELVRRVGERLGELDEPRVPVDEGAVADRSSTSPENELHRRAFLRRLWSEIVELPHNQRVALLLNLRVAAGQDAVELFLACGIADLEELAWVLGLQAPDVGRLLDDLPLDDAAIAARLGLTARQVVNLRLSARRRLARRLKEFLA